MKFKPRLGSLSWRWFLIVDTNGVAGYQAGADLVVRLDSPQNLLKLGLGTFT